MTGTIDHAAIQHNGADGLHVQSATVQTLNFTVSDSVVSDNAAHGIAIAGGNGSATINVMVRNTTINNNGTGGLDATGPGATLRVTRSTITANGAGWFINTNGTISSYADNIFDGNTSVNTAPPTAATYK